MNREQLLQSPDVPAKAVGAVYMCAVGFMAVA